MVPQMKKRTAGLLVGAVAAVVTTIFVLPYILVFVYVCIWALCDMYYHYQGSQLDLSNPAVRRGVKLNDAALKLAMQHSGPRRIDDIASDYFPPGTSVQDAITMLKSTGHAWLEGPRLFHTRLRDGKTTEWFGFRACIPYVGGSQVWFDIETDQPPTKIRHARGSTMSGY